MEEIPKVIHYCWFGRGLMPASQRQYIDSWRKVMPEYQIKCWNEDNFNINRYNFASQAYKKKLYSFVTDVVRFYALYTEGGIYMDTDVKVFKSYDEFLFHDVFSGIQIYQEQFFEGKYLLDKNGLPFNKDEIFTEGLGFNAAVIGAKKGNKFIKECLDFFTKKDFILADGTLYNKIINPAIMAHLALKYGFRYINIKQEFSSNIIVYQSNIFACSELDMDESSYSMHYSAQSWVPKTKDELYLIKLDKLNLLVTYYKYIVIKRKIKKAVKKLLQK